MPEHHFLNLGAGVQSTALYLMAMEGEIHRIDAAIFADVQEEPDDVYAHLDWLDSLKGPPIIRVTAGRLGDALDQGSDANGNKRTDGGHYISIPAYTLNPQTGGKGMIQRQCTADFKVKPIERAIREHCGGQFGRPLPKDVVVTQYMGLSYDEPKRVIRVKQRFMAKPSNWKVEFPLWDLEMTRADCVAYLKDRVPHEVPRSACVFCPFKSDAEWRRLRDTDPKGWERAVHIDKVCRTGSGLDAHRYLHKACVPLDEVDLRPA
ncbi:hypothetical protein EBQ81_01990, partial [bacterium]|nr:hypothetical protein [bacterium]